MSGMELLREKINGSGYKVSHVADRCGLTYQGFLKKSKGETEFKASEIAVLKDLLNLTDSEMQAIFFLPD